MTSDVLGLQFRNNTTTSKVKRRSLDLQDFLMNSPPTPPVGSLASSLKEDEKSKSGDWIDKIMLNRRSSHIDMYVALGKQDFPIRISFDSRYLISFQRVNT